MEIKYVSHDKKGNKKKNRIDKILKAREEDFQY